MEVLLALPNLTYTPPIVVIPELQLHFQHPTFGPIATISKICNILVVGSENDAINYGGFTPKRVESEV